MRAIKIFKTALITASALWSIKYDKERDEIICAIDASKEKWEDVLI